MAFFSYNLASYIHFDSIELSRSQKEKHSIRYRFYVNFKNKSEYKKPETLSPVLGDKEITS